MTSLSPATLTLPEVDLSGITTIPTPTSPFLSSVCDPLSATCNGLKPTQNSIDSNIQAIDISTSISSGNSITSAASSAMTDVSTTNALKAHSNTTLLVAIIIFVITSILLVGGLWFLLRRRQKMAVRNDQEILAQFTPYPFAIGNLGSMNSSGPVDVEKKPDEKGSSTVVPTFWATMTPQSEHSDKSEVKHARLVKQTRPPSLG